MNGWWLCGKKHNHKDKNKGKDIGAAKYKVWDQGGAKNPRSQPLSKAANNANRGKNHMHGFSMQVRLVTNTKGPNSEGLGLSLHATKKRARRDQTIPIATLVKNALKGQQPFTILLYPTKSPSPSWV